MSLCHNLSTMQWVIFVRNEFGGILYERLHVLLLIATTMAPGFSLGEK